jgi:low temperature requirement protein LtrA
MAQFSCALRSLWQRFSLRVEEEWFVLRLTICSLCYNSLTSGSTVMDTALEPMFWFVEHFIRYLGPVRKQLRFIGHSVYLLDISTAHQFFSQSQRGQ